MKTREDVRKLMARVFDECLATHQVANQEYASEGDALANFNEVALDAQTNRKVVWYILASKHWRGIRAWITGFRSQRENVRGRIKDLIVYLVLLYAIVEEEEDASRRLSEVRDQNPAPRS